MVESKYVLNGLIAGFIAGLVTSIILIISIITQDLDTIIEYSIKEAQKFIPLHDIGIMREYIRLGIIVSPIITIIIISILGALFGHYMSILIKR